MSDTRKDRKTRKSGSKARKAMLPKRELRAVAARYNISRLGKGVAAKLNRFLEDESEKLLRSAALSCDGRKRSTLTGEDANVAISQHRTIPGGLY